MSETKRTPGPWEHNCFRIYSHLRIICEMQDYPEDLDQHVAIQERDANADFIVRAANCFDDLVEVLRELENHASKYGGVPKSATKLWDKARAALAHANVE